MPRVCGIAQGPRAGCGGIPIATQETSIGSQWLVLLWTIRRDYSGEALGDISKASIQGKMTDDGVPGERKANAFLYDLTLDRTHTDRSLPFLGLRRLSPASTNR